ncbi:hypothetical protein ILYODFUR_035166, partial [Ilyodon furcidens]
VHVPAQEGFNEGVQVDPPRVPVPVFSDEDVDTISSTSPEPLHGLALFSKTPSRVLLASTSLSRSLSRVPAVPPAFSRVPNQDYRPGVVPLTSVIPVFPSLSLRWCGLRITLTVTSCETCINKAASTETRTDERLLHLIYCLQHCSKK